jgi:hypothetical protein
MEIDSNRDWHHLRGDHDPECVFAGEPVLTVPATPENIEWLARTWNRRVEK